MFYISEFGFMIYLEVDGSIFRRSWKSLLDAVFKFWKKESESFDTIYKEVGFRWNRYLPNFDWYFQFSSLLRSKRTDIYFLMQITMLEFEKFLHLSRVLLIKLYIFCETGIRHKMLWSIKCYLLGFCYYLRH